MSKLSGKEAYDKLQQMLKEKRDNFRVMERQVDIDTQMEYFDAAKEIKKNLPENTDNFIKNTDKKLENPEVKIEDKKELLNELASLENVKAFRTLEKYMNNPDQELNDWAYMAYQESLMLMESSFSEEDKVFISSGMGGKGDKLRYFVVFIRNKLENPFSDIQKKLITKEIKYQFDNNEAEFEDDNFSDKYVMFTCLIPLEVNVSALFKNIIYEINQFGNILSENFLVTNVKKLSEEEIDEFIAEKEKNNSDNIEDVEDFDPDDEPFDPFDDDDEE